MSADKETHPDFSDLVDELHDCTHKILGAVHALYLIAEEVRELGANNPKATAFHVLRNLIEDEAERAGDVTDKIWKAGRAAR